MVRPLCIWPPPSKNTNTTTVCPSPGGSKCTADTHQNKYPSFPSGSRNVLLQKPAVSRAAPPRRASSHAPVSNRTVYAPSPAAALAGAPMPATGRPGAAGALQAGNKDKVGALSAHYCSSCCCVPSSSPPEPLHQTNYSGSSRPSAPAARRRPLTPPAHTCSLAALRIPLPLTAQPPQAPHLADT